MVLTQFNILPIYWKDKSTINSWFWHSLIFIIVTQISKILFEKWNSFKTKALLIISLMINRTFYLIISSSANYFFTGRPQQYCVFKLSSVTSFNVTKRGIWINYSYITQVLQSYQVLGLVQPIQPTSTECKRSKVLVNAV